MSKQTGKRISGRRRKIDHQMRDAYLHAYQTCYASPHNVTTTILSALPSGPARRRTHRQRVLWARVKYPSALSSHRARVCPSRTETRASRSDWETLPQALSSDTAPLRASDRPYLPPRPLTCGRAQWQVACLVVLGLVLHHLRVVLCLNRCHSMPLDCSHVLFTG